jgi:uncharacterized protein with FMN-binding domain
MKKVFKVVLIMFGIILSICLIMIHFDLKHQKEIKNLVIKDIDLNEIEDGEYSGSFSKYRWNINVKVKIKDHKITNINFFNNTDISDNFKNKLINNVIEKQKVNIDTISGATVSTKALLKAIEDALD